LQIEHLHGRVFLGGIGETLVTQAEGRGHRRFFENYRKLSSTRKGSQ